MKLVATNTFLLVSASVVNIAPLATDLSIFAHPIVLILTHPIVLLVASLSAVIGILTAYFNLVNDKIIGTNAYTYFFLAKGFIIGAFSAPLLFLIMLGFGEQILEIIGIEVHDNNRSVIAPISLIVSILWARDLSQYVYKLLRRKNNDNSNE